jgi:hypothetical protein
MSRHLFRGASLLALIGGSAVVAAVASANFPARVAGQAEPTALVDLHDASTLRAQFNRDRGLIRLVLLVSPT